MPVPFSVVDGLTARDLIRAPEPGHLPRIVNAARALERQGVGAIATTCGFFARYPSEVAGSLRVPFWSSSLLLVPL